MKGGWSKSREEEMSVPLRWARETVQPLPAAPERREILEEKDEEEQKEEEDIRTSCQQPSIRPTRSRRQWSAHAKFQGPTRRTQRRSPRRAMGGSPNVPRASPMVNSSRGHAVVQCRVVPGRLGGSAGGWATSGAEVVADF